MEAYKRRQAILALLRDTGEVAIDDLAQRFAVSPNSIRNDLDSLAADGQLNRVRGGAVALDGVLTLRPGGSGAAPRTAFAMRAGVQRREKENLGRWAASLVKDGDAIILDDSSSVFQLATYLRERRNLTVVTAGLRFDEVGLAVADRRPAAPMPHTRDRTSQLSHHLGVNHQLLPNRLLAFASVSTAFDPSTPVDARTGRIQDNETTLGYEGGMKGRTRDGRFEGSASAFLLYNRHIARRNPLYDDPILDANQTQPQLVAAGEERFLDDRGDHRRVEQTQIHALAGERGRNFIGRHPTAG